MYKMKEYKEGKLTFIELRNESNSSWLKVVPERGGIITRLGIRGEELLFINEETLHNVEKNIRGGIPILFPISGQLTNGQYEWDGKTYTMKNHGFARDLPWEVVEINTYEEEALIKIKLESNDETKTVYPFEFELVFTYILRENELIIDQTYQNKSTKEMPIYAGFHPYFKTANKQLKIDTDASDYLDYNDMQNKRIEGVISIDQKESYLLKSGTRSIRFSLEEIDKLVTINYGKEFPYIVLWSEEGQGFVCVEPWMAKTDELNKKDELTMIHPGKGIHTKVSISI
ncbi:aldose epimerase family protein [Metabacillus bambusae]|uniref:Aldose epimerase n=1 Tax=Metabacillus bambusae TaxID=2795218 RepID=A0ABS3N519_9BACI|nr:aldose epimerase [Metabacillus bambusae]MBO1512978.1 aldose epimerase [Metabacillus bambusae]